MEKDRQELLNKLKAGGSGGGVDSQAYEIMKGENEAMEKKVKKITKTLKELKEKYETKITKLELDLSRKAEKEAMVENQQKFFDNLHRMENDTDENITKMVGDELKKMGEQLNMQSKIIDKKMAKVYQDIDVNKINQAVDKKLNKDEARNLMDNQDGKLLQIEKQVKQLYQKIERLEALIENLALAIKNIEMGQQQPRSSNNGALIRQTTLNQDQVHCLSCGQTQIANAIHTPPHRSRQFVDQAISAYPDTHLKAVEYQHSPPAERRPVQIVSELSHHDDSRAQNLSGSNSQQINFNPQFQKSGTSQNRPLSSNVRQGSQSYQTNTRQFPTYFNQKSKSNNLSFGGGNQNQQPVQNNLNQSYSGSYYSNTNIRNSISIKKNNTGQIRGGHLKKVLGLKSDLQSNIQSRPKSKGGIGLIDDPNMERVFRQVDQ